VRSYLQNLHELGHIRYLMLSSENVGKLGALQIIAGAAPGEMIAYADDDTFFYPGWLSAHLSVFSKFPKVGMVSGSPERTLFDHGISTNLRLANEDRQIAATYGQTISEDWERDWAIALGYDPEEFLAKVQKLQDITLEVSGFKAYATACHNQFLSPKDVIRAALGNEWSGRLMGGLNEFDDAVDAAGWMRLTTHTRTTRLIGNTLSAEMAREAQHHGIDMKRSALPERPAASSQITRRLLRFGPVRWLLQGLYNRLFWILTGQAGDWVEPGEGSGSAEGT
jgi:hypothetical protein